MKKLVFVIVTILFSMTPAQAQSLSLGANVGLPTGAAGDYASLQLGADLAYRVGLMGIVEVGPMIGYSRFFEDSAADGVNWGENDIQFMPLAASGRFNLLTLKAGLDVGYALGLNNGNNGGFYYRPSVGFNILMLGLIASYQGITMDGENFSSINLGVELDL